MWQFCMTWWFLNRLRKITLKESRASGRTIGWTQDGLAEILAKYSTRRLSYVFFWKRFNKEARVKSKRGEYSLIIVECLNSKFIEFADGADAAGNVGKCLFTTSTGREWLGLFGFWNASFKHMKPLGVLISACVSVITYFIGVSSR